MAPIKDFSTKDFTTSSSSFSSPQDDLFETVEATPILRDEPKESTPGVYVRTREASTDANDLDMLWSGNRAFHMRDERSPILFLVIGFIAGAVCAGAVAFFLISSQPSQPDMGANPLTTPAVKDADLQPLKTRKIIPAVPTESTALPTEPTTTSTVTLPPAGETAPPTTTTRQVAPTAAPTATTSTPTAQITAATGGQKHIVKSGDTLEAIAKRYYNNGSPDMVKRIMNANNMSNPDRLSLDQELIIPPKAY